MSNSTPWSSCSSALTSGISVSTGLKDLTLSRKRLSSKRSSRRSVLRVFFAPSSLLSSSRPLPEGWPSLKDLLRLAASALLSCGSYGCSPGGLTPTTSAPLSELSMRCLALSCFWRARPNAEAFSLGLRLTLRWMPGAPPSSVEACKFSRADEEPLGDNWRYRTDDNLVSGTKVALPAEPPGVTPVCS